MDTTDQQPGSPDERVGEGATRFEEGRLAGVLLGLLAIAVAMRRRTRRIQTQTSAE